MKVRDFFFLHKSLIFRTPWAILIFEIGNFLSARNVYERTFFLEIVILVDSFIHLCRSKDSKSYIMVMG